MTTFAQFLTLKEAARQPKANHWKCTETGCSKTADVMSWDNEAGRDEKECPKCGGTMKKATGDRMIPIDTGH